MQPILRNFMFVGAASLMAILPLIAPHAGAEAARPMQTDTAVPASGSMSTNTVQIRDYAFEPATIIVAPGTAVTWVNADNDPHTVVADDRAYRSAPMDTDGRYTRVYASQGEYRYFCSLHPYMTGIVIVQEQGSQPEAAGPQGS